MRVQKINFFCLGLTRAGISFPDIELMEELAQDDAIPVTLPDGSAGSFKDIKEGQHIQIRYLGHRVLWKNAWIPDVEEVEITKEVKKDV